ncbi:MAG: caspase family protein [Saprospiraceae bacterium]|nr:caspase family protein [Saprospiraceae bacterium]
MLTRSSILLLSLSLMMPFLGLGQKTSLSIKPKITTRAIVVGVSDYAEISDLEFAHRDAEAFADFLRAETSWKVEPENLHLLLNEEATMPKFHKAMKWLVAETKPKDRTIIYFSGHGDVEGSVGGRLGYLLLHNSPPVDYPLGGACPVEYLDAMIATLSQDKQSEVILITDACRSGKLAGSENNGPGLTNQAIGENFGEVIKIMSCAKDQYSLEHKDWGGGRGLFSYHLINGLTGLADEDEDEKIFIYELSDYLPRQVRKVSRQYGELQIPIVIGPQEVALNTVDTNQLFDLYAELAAEEGQTISMAPARKGGTEQLSELNAGLATEEGQTMGMSPAHKGGTEQIDSSFFRLLEQFNSSLGQGHLLYPTEASAYATLQQLQSYSSFDSLLNVATNNLAVALQEEAQVALNSYLKTPSKELAKRWRQSNVYQFYPEYLDLAADLLGEKDYFFQDLRARANYFRGINIRLLGEKTKDQQKLQEALDIQVGALETQPNSGHTLNEVGYILFLLDRKAEAVDYFRQAAEAVPSWVLPQSNLAESYRKLGKYAEAETAALKAVALDSTLAMAVNNLGLIYFMQERDAEAKVQFDKAVIKDPTYAATYFNLASWHYFYQQYDLAETNAQKYIALQANDAGGYQMLGRIYRAWKKPQQGAAAFQKSLDLNPAFDLALYNFAALQYEQGLYQEAIELLLRYKALDPSDTDVHWLLLCCYALQENYDKALSTLTVLLEDLKFDDQESLESDDDLKQLRALAEYQALIKRYFPDK